MNQFWDRLGISASLLCILHCLLTPVLIVAVPMTGAYFTHGYFHIAIAALVIPVAFWALLNGYRLHRNPRVLVFGALGLIFVSLALLQHSDIKAEFMLMIVGGFLLTWAHYTNLRCCRFPKNSTQAQP